jgi:hypothetical protein
VPTAPGEESPQAAAISPFGVFAMRGGGGIPLSDRPGRPVGGDFVGRDRQLGELLAGLRDAIEAAAASS